MPDNECVFCHIVSGKIPARKVFEDEKVLAVLDINPASNGHVIVLSKEHVSIMPQMNDDLVAHLGKVARNISKILIQRLKVEGTSVFVANGVVAGQRAPHFMLHVIPRRNDDGINLQVKGSPLSEADMKDSFAKLTGSVGKRSKPESKSSADLDSITSLLAGDKQ